MADLIVVQQLQLVHMQQQLLVLMLVLKMQQQL
jgi:hypothetical protein